MDGVKQECRKHRKRWKKRSFTYKSRFPPGLLPYSDFRPETTDDEPLNIASIV
jgi:hypothetical protein